MTLVVRTADPFTPTIRRMVADVHERSATAAYAHLFTDPFPRDETRLRWDHYTGRVALATADGTVVGFAAWRDDELDALYVLPEAAGAGAGGLLMAAAHGASRLWVLEENHHARGFYEHRGWRPSGRVRQQYGDVRELEYVCSPA